MYQYYYHSDHLGSSSLITNLDGEVVQHVEYVPFGSIFLEERNNTWNTPYLFNAKELDEETGLYYYYYGARYYDPRISLWLSTDPLQEKYPNISTYAYCIQNPVKFIDPTGMLAWEPDGNGQLRAQEGDNMETLKSYLTEIHGEYGMAQDEWTELESQVKEIQGASVGGDISGNTISSSTGLFENLVGAYLVTKANSDPSWGYPSELDGQGNLCSPTTFNRVDKAMEFVYGKDILGKLSGANPLYARWNAFENAKGIKYGEEMIPNMGYGTSVNEKRILEGGLKSGAVLRMTQSPGPQNTPISWHAVIFLNYTYNDAGDIDGLTYWQQKTSIGYINSIKFSYDNKGAYSFRNGYKPKLGANFK